MRSNFTARVHLSVVLAALLLLASVLGALAQSYPLTPPGSVKQYSWDPRDSGGSPKWTNGNNPGYFEGETAAMTAEIVNQEGNIFNLPICLQVYETPLPTKAYAFTAFEPFNTTWRMPNLPPPSLPGPGASITYDAMGNPVGPEWDLGHPSVYGYNLEIISVTDPLMGAAAGCNTNELGVTVTYKPLAKAGAYIVWGGHIARAGDPLPAGAPDLSVPSGKSAGYAVGVFQARLKTAQADKTLPFKVSVPTAVALSSLTAVGGSSAGVAVFAVVVAAGLAGLARARRRK